MIQVGDMDIPEEQMLHNYSNRQVVIGWSIGVGHFRYNTMTMPSLILSGETVDVITQHNHEVTFILPIQAVEILLQEIIELRQHPQYAGLLDQGATFAEGTGFPDDHRDDGVDSIDGP